MGERADRSTWTSPGCRCCRGPRGANTTSDRLEPRRKRPCCRNMGYAPARMRPPPPTPAALHSDRGRASGSPVSEHRVSSERRRGEGHMALERRWAARGGTIAERCHRSWTHPLRQLPTYRATARRDRRSRLQQSPRGCRAKTASLFGSLLERAQELPQHHGFSGSNGSCRASKPAEAMCWPLNMA
jgi:hypothetical protein